MVSGCNGLRQPVGATDRIGARVVHQSLSYSRAPGLYKVYAGITLPNAASVGLHEAMGFKPVGIYRGVGYKLGSWHDVGWWQLSLQPESDEPPPPRRVFRRSVILELCKKRSKQVNSW